MEKRPLFSIITVTLDNLKGLHKTHESIKSQSYQIFEWIVVDGGSRDGTVGFLRHSGALWSSEKDLGIYDAMNKGIERSKGQYLLFLNAGDELADISVLANIKRAIGPQAIDFIYGDSFEDGRHKPARPYTSSDWGMFTHHQAMLYRRDAVGDLRYDLDYEIAADYDFTLRFLKSSPKILYCGFPLCVFETGGVSQKNAQLGRREQFRIRKNLSESSTKNAFIYAAQSAAWKFRKLMPRAYWILKSSGSKNSGFAQT